jgi:hypothetical protein
MLKRLTNQAADQRKIVATANVADLSPENVHRDQGLSSRTCAAPRDGDDDSVTFFLSAGHWPRVFPGL